LLVVENAQGRLMWTVIAARVVELALAFFTAIKSVAAAILQWRATNLGEVQGRADSDAEHDAAARRANDQMQSISDKPAGRDELIRRLEEGSA
jgi:hypothetical protein